MVTDSSEPLPWEDSYTEDEAEPCPSCKQPGEETGHWYWRCTTDSEECNVVSFVTVDRSRRIKERLKEVRD